MRASLIFTGKIQINIRRLIAVKSQKCFKRNIMTRRDAYQLRIQDSFSEAIKPGPTLPSVINSLCLHFGHT